MPQQPKTHLAALLLLLFSIGLSASAQSPSDPGLAARPLRGPEGDSEDAVRARLIGMGRFESRVQDHLWYLTREIGPRLTTSSGLDRAYEWTRAQFESFGLEAWIERYDEWPVGFDRGPSYGRWLGREPRELRYLTRAWSAGTAGPVRGPAILHPTTMAELEELRGKLTGAWLLSPARIPGVSRVKREVRTAMRELCEEERIAGRIQRASGSGLLLNSGRAPQSMDEIPLDVTVSLHHEDFDALLHALEDGEQAQLEFDLANHFREGPIALCNVIAEIKGTEFPDEYVIVQAHLDSWDSAEGACDNGTGVATTLEAARLLMRAGARPRRSIRFVLYSGEEQGLHGSRAYVRDHASELQRISGVLNHDTGTNYLAGILCTPHMRTAFERVFKPVMELDPERPFELIYVAGIDPGPSDHAPFVKAGVPAFHWKQDRTGYDYIHHTQHDRYEMANPADQRHSSLVAALGAYGIAMLDKPLDRTNLRAPATRRIGVRLEGLAVQRVYDGGRASLAGWEKGDVVLAVDGVDMGDKDALIEAVQKRGARKQVLLKRGEQRIETVLDYVDDPDEAERDRYHENLEQLRDSRR